MKKMLLALSVASIALSCSKKSTSESTTSTSYSLKVRMASSGASSAVSVMNMENDFDALTVSDSTFLNSSIGSGAAEEVTFKVTKMTLGKSSDSAVSVPIFSDSSGKALTVRGASVDMSNFFTKLECVDSSGNAITVPSGSTCECGVKSDGTLISKVSTTLPDGTTGMGCPALATGEEPPLGVMSVDQTGTFDTLTVEFVNLGQMKGCATGKFKSNSSDTTGTSATYCTKLGYGLDSGLSTTTSTFPSSGSENMNVYLSKSGPGSTTFTKTFSIPNGGITLDGTTTPSITLLIDTGRLVRFYNANTNFSTPGPTYNSYASKAFFFTTTFEDSLYIFVGKPGTIKGYRWATSASNWSTSSAPSDRLCTSDCKVIAGWMTLILDSTGSPIVASLMPDDDNALTVIKGGNYSSTTTSALDSSAIVQNSTTDWNIGYRLGTDYSGTIYGFCPSISVSSSCNGTFSLPTASAGKSWGEVTFVRKL